MKLGKLTVEFTNGNEAHFAQATEPEVHDNRVWARAKAVDGWVHFSWRNEAVASWSWIPNMAGPKLRRWTGSR